MKIIDPQTFKDTFQYFDKEIVVEIIDIFIQEYPDRMTNIRTAMDTKAYADLKFHAHSMKGVVANFMTPEVQALARTLEMAGTNQDLSGADEVYVEFVEKSSWLLDDLKLIREEYL